MNDASPESAVGGGIAEVDLTLRSARELAAVLETVPAAVWIARDRECRVISGNRFANALLRMPEGANHSKSAPEGERPQNFRVFDLDGKEIPAEELPVQVAARTGTSQRAVRELLVFDDGTRRALFGNAEPLLAADGTVIGAVSAFVDITELERVQEELKRELQRKDDFIATLAHELRNPLAAIRFTAATFRAGANDVQVAKWRDTIERQSAHLARLLDDLLDISRISRNTVTLARRTLDLRDTVAEAIEVAQPAIQSGEHRLDVSLPDHAVCVEGDGERLLQVIGNLLSNAVKYTAHSGQIRLTLTVEAGQAVLRVADNGVGFQPDQAALLFEPFSQLHRELKVAQSGLGIGLAVVRQLVRLHGGEAEAVSDGPGRGAVFTVRLPCSSTAPANGAVPPDAIAPVADGLRVLLVEDNVDAADSLSMFLRDAGCEVQVAHTGLEALRLAGQSEPALILLDLGLPDMSGFDVARAINALPTLGSPLIVAVSGWAQDVDKKRSQEAGIDLHLAKPVDPQKLLELLGTLTRGI